MTSVFGAAWRGAYPQLEAAFGEPAGFEHHPMSRADVDSKGGPDPGRPVTTFTAIFDAETVAGQMDGRGRAGSWTEPVISTQPQIDVAESAFAERPRTKDQILRVETGVRYVISEVKPSDLGRLVLRLNLA